MRIFLDTPTEPMMPSLLYEYGRAVEANGRTAAVTLVRVEVDDEQLADATATAARRKKNPTPTIQWLSEKTRSRIAAARTGNRCTKCGLTLGEGKAGIKRIRIHVRQHWTKYFCPCNLGRGSKAHQRSLDRADAHGGPSESVHEVDRENYPNFCRKYGLPERDMGGCRPYLKPDGRPSLNKRGLPLSVMTARPSWRPS